MRECRAADGALRNQSTPTAVGRVEAAGVRQGRML